MPFLRCTVPAGATSLAEAGFPLEPDALKEQLRASFQEHLGISFRLSVFSGEEQAMAGKLRQEKYCSDAWNLAGEAP
jgi:lipoate-protein ligase A